MRAYVTSARARAQTHRNTDTHTHTHVHLGYYRKVFDTDIPE